MENLANLTELGDLSKVGNRNGRIAMSTQILDVPETSQNVAQKETLEQFVALERERLEALARALRTKQEELDRRESVLNARIAALETVVRLNSADAVRDRERSQKLDALEAECVKRANALDVREAETRRLRDETETAARRLLEVKEALDEKERQFEERSRRALDSIRRQKDELLRLVREIENAPEPETARSAS